MGRQFTTSTKTGLARSVGKIPRKGSPSKAQVMRAIRFGDPSVHAPVRRWGRLGKFRSARLIVNGWDC
jgi:hypothetical protein